MPSCMGCGGRGSPGDPCFCPEPCERCSELEVENEKIKEALDALRKSLQIFGECRQLICDDEKHFQYMNRMYLDACKALEKK